MLTKDLLQFTSRKGKIAPTFISYKAVGDVARDLRDVFVEAPGLSLSEIEARAADVGATPACSAGLLKLLMDRCEFDEPGDYVLTERWRLVEIAEEIRAKGAWTKRAEFEEMMLARAGGDLGVSRDQLFADHPSKRKCLKFRDISAEDLVDKYNVSLVQTLMLFADEVKIKVFGSSLVEKRAVFRHLKFHGLMTEVDVNKDAKELVLHLSGPLRLFLKSNTYGIRLARFLPTILHLKEWQIDADIHLKNKRLTLSLDQTAPLKPHKNRGLAGYTPEEYSAVMTAFNEDDHSWRMSVSEDFVHVGKQSYCFPDFEVTKDKQAVHVELFHPWHKGQILSRVQAAAEAKVSNFRVGVEKSLLKDKDVKVAVEASPWFDAYGFTFSQFPTSKQILKAVERNV